jgi:hypothetical protein
MDPIGVEKSVGTRFYLVSALPSLLTVGGIWLMWATGAFASRPSLRTLNHRVGHASVALVVVLGSAFLLGIVTYPLQLRAVKVAEGYFAIGSRTAEVLATFGIARHSRRRGAAQRELNVLSSYEHHLKSASPDERQERGAEIDRALRYLKGASERAPSRIVHLDTLIGGLPVPRNIVPTRLGNTLRAAEDKPLDRYGIPGVKGMGHLVALMPADYTARVDDIRNDLDQAVRMMLAWVSLAVAALVFFIDDGPWSFISVGCWVLAMWSYRGAITVAESYGRLINRSFDLFRYRLLEANCIERPMTFDEQTTCFGELFKVFDGTEQPTHLRFLPPTKPEPVATTATVATR